MLNKNKILMMAVAGVIAGLSSGAKSQTFYQCMQCNGSQFYYQGKCYANCPYGYVFDYGALKCRKELCIRTFRIEQLTSRRNTNEFFSNDIYVDDANGMKVICKDFIGMNHKFLPSLVLNDSVGLNLDDECKIELHRIGRPVSYFENSYREGRDTIKEWRCEEYLD